MVAIFSSQAGRLNFMTAGSRTGWTMPWVVSKKPPREWAMAWQAPRLALLKLMPAAVAAMDRCSRARGSRVLRARWRLSRMRWMAFRACVSVRVWAMRDT